ncbi:DUF998 domain-containing protein [Mycolicibacterium flavescens]|uniref:DUF998 domain-containing protein n=1 Tax=Mycolicibacterium flavescens TaxID=1776 RepID=A0A1E3RP51_MYCFV|nr:DUF998 domain-containing protein [Mycolicibacterium flavescens]MCV7281312.1 DUF998 domain-containing protein [Mycolicibacterium flavescens]ODQ91177.1 hypothetical protein BHQ18_07235 [Mycolicibacterium flavescens]
MSTPVHRRVLVAGAGCWIVASLGFVVLELLAAVAVPGYSYTEHYISTLGVPAWSPRAYLLNGALYLQGVLFVAGAVLVSRAVRARWSGAVFVVLAVVAAAGDFLVAFVYGGSPLWNDGHQSLHALGAVLAIFGGNLAIIAGTAVAGRAVGGRTYRVAGLLIAAAGLVIFALLQNYDYWAVRYAPIGAVERGCVYTVMLWQLLTGVVLLVRGRALRSAG